MPPKGFLLAKLHNLATKVNSGGMAVKMRGLWATVEYLVAEVSHSSLPANA